MTAAVLTPAEAVAEARRERDLVINLAEEADITGWDRRIIDQAIRAFAAQGRPFSANDMRELLPDVRASLIGARFLAAANQSLIRRVGLIPSTKKNTHTKPVAVWIRAQHTEEVSA